MNSGSGQLDEDKMVGAEWRVSPLELASVLQRVRCDPKDKRIGFDLFPFTEDSAQDAHRRVLQWESIWDLAARIGKKRLFEAQAGDDAVGAYAAVCEALELNRAFIDRLSMDTEK